MGEVHVDSHQGRVDHARWRVNFLRSLFESHRLSNSRFDPHWEEKLEMHGKKLEEAEQELKKLEGEEGEVQA